jgi:hypothetical protein
MPKHKTGDERIQEALAAIEENAGTAAAHWVDDRLPWSDQVTLEAWSAEISLANWAALPLESEKRRRRLVRGVLLAYKAADVSRFRTATVKEALKKETEGDLKARLLKFLPSTQIAGNFSARTTWDPGRFTDPTNHNTGGFRYIVTGVVKESRLASRGYMATQQDTEDFVSYLNKFPPEHLSIQHQGKVGQQKEILHIKSALRYLRSPDLLRYDIISTSLIDQGHVSSYYPWGFILRVPPENIISANRSDQAVTNRPKNVINEMQRVNREKGLSTPEEILAATTGRNGDTGYNEVVVIGRSPEQKQVDVTGIFVKVAPGNNLYIRSRQNDDEPFVHDLIDEIDACSRQHNIPIVNIPDSSSKASTVAWPF